jgi:hypothetical protein
MIETGSAAPAELAVPSACSSRLEVIMNIRQFAVPVILGFAVATLAPAVSRAADENNAQSEQQPKPKGGAMKGAAGGAAVSKMSGGSAKKGAAVGGAAGAAEKHHSKKNIEKEGHN